jgi:hypothetical protein
MNGEPGQKSIAAGEGKVGSAGKALKRPEERYLPVFP